MLRRARLLAVMAAGGAILAGAGAGRAQSEMEQVSALSAQLSANQIEVVQRNIDVATKALQAFSLELLEEHLAHCVVEAAQRGGSEADEKVREASEAIARLVRS